MTDGATESIVELRGVSRSFRATRNGAVRALDTVDLAVESGEFVCLIGPTGCGKTTLLNMIAGLLSPDTGSVDVRGGQGPRGNVPCVFQHYTLFPWRSILRNVAFGPEMRGTPRGERAEAARALLERVGLAGFERALPHELSGGMRQRAAIAQALAAGSGLLLMDEPFGAVDDATRRDLQDMLVDIWRERGMTILFVTHNIDEALYLANRVVVFSPRPGRIVGEIPVDLARPRDCLSSEFTDLFVRVREMLG